MTNVKKHGLYVVLEGPEGVGKTLQTQMLANRLTKEGYLVRLFREPDSQTNITARAIRTITQNPFYPMNSRTEVLLYNAARSQSLEVIKNSREQGVICLCDRNYLTTLGVQYYGRGDIPDYDTINNIISFAVGDMEPDITIILDAPAIELQKRSRKRDRGERFDNLALEFLERVRAGYLIEAKKRNIPVITAVGTPEEINNTIWDILHGSKAPKYNPQAVLTPPITLPKNSVKAEQIANAPKLTEPPIGNSETGQIYLDKIVTNTTGSVYAFTNAEKAETVATALFEQTGRTGDLRTNLLNYLQDNRNTEGWRHKSPLQQAINHYFVVENASNILTKKLEWGRLATYFEQNSGTIDYYKKDKFNKYKYYIPKNLPNDVKKQYCASLDQIFKKYSQMLSELTDYIRKNSNIPKSQQNQAWLHKTSVEAKNALRHALPAAAKTTVGISISERSLKRLIMHLLWDDLPEANTTGKRLMNEACKIIPNFAKNIQSPNEPNSNIAYHNKRIKEVKAIADSISAGYSSDVTAVKLTDVWPRNELDIVPDILYEYSNLSLNEIRQSIAAWPYKQKLEVFEAYIGERHDRTQKPGRALEKVQYSWDIICDYSSFCDLQRHRMVNDITWQDLSPRYGYDIPQIVEQAGIAEQYLDCFDISVELYNLLQQQGFDSEAQYATLLGHKMRWKATYNAREAFHIHELRTTQQDEKGYRKLVLAMHEELLKVHPLLGEAMKFVKH